MIWTPICERCGGVRRGLTPAERGPLSLYRFHRWCCCAEPDCAPCPGGTPSSLDLTLSGITLCSCLLFARPCGSGASADSADYAGTIDGTYSLSGVGAGPCKLRYLEADAVTGTEYSNEDCTGEVATCTVDLEMQVEYSESGGQTYAGVLVGLGGLTGITVFEGCVAVDSCGDDFAVSNNQTSSECDSGGASNAPCATDGGLVAGYGGTASAVIT